MDPYAKPKKHKVGAQRPKISHRPRSIDIPLSLPGVVGESFRSSALA